MACLWYVVDEADLDALEEAATGLRFYLHGFYGEPHKDRDHDKPNVDKFIKLAREHIANGRDVYYSNWW